MFSTVGGGGGGSVLWGDTMTTVRDIVSAKGDIFSTMWDIQYRGGYHLLLFEYHGGT